jgi:hypothetical protein
MDSTIQLESFAAVAFQACDTTAAFDAMLSL